MSKWIKAPVLSVCLFCLGCEKAERSEIEVEAGVAESRDEQEKLAERGGLSDGHVDTYLGPTRVGIEYQYLMMVSGGGQPPMRYTSTYRIAGVKEIKGKSYHEVHVDTGGYPALDNFVEYYRHGEDGHYAIAHDDETQTEFLSFPLPIPTEVGASWQVKRPGKEPEPCRVLGFETVTIFGVTYEDCLKIRRDAEGCRMTGWLAKGIGSVKFVQQFEQGVLVFLRKPDGDHKKTADGEAPPAVED